MRYVLVLALVVALTVATGCTKKQSAAAEPPQPAGDTVQTTPAGSSGDTSGTSGTADVPAAIREYLQRGAKSADAQWVAAVVPGPAAVAGLWVARADLTGARRVAADGLAAEAVPVWTPGGGLLFADKDGDWQQAAGPEWKPQAFLPDLLKGKRARIRPGAFSPNGQQFIYSLAKGAQQESWLAGLDGKNVRSLGLDVTAGWSGSELVVAPTGK